MTKKTVYTIEMPENLEFPMKFVDIVSAFELINKLFKKDIARFIVIKENGVFVKSIINPRYKLVNNQEWIKAHNVGIFSDAFILYDNNQKFYYIKK